ncbi:MAG: DUF5813 family protein [Haloferacaceae archaeon]
MTAVPDRVARAFRDHGSFERVGDGEYESVTTPFEGVVAVAPGEDGRMAFDVTVRVPTLGEVVDGRVADVVEDGWYETFALRVADVGGVMRGERDVAPEVHRRGGEVVVEWSFEDVNERRGVDDAGALVDYVEGTYAQGIVPGYDYLPPASDIVDRARQHGER